MNVSAPFSQISIQAQDSSEQPVSARPTSIIPILLSGGSSTALWPLSRLSTPQQFHAVQSTLTILQEAALRLRPRLDLGVDIAHPIVICDYEHRFLASSQLHSCGLREPKLLLMPGGIGSAPAIAAAALLVMERDPNALIWIVRDDTPEIDIASLQNLLPQAVHSAHEGRLVAFGSKDCADGAIFGKIQLGEVLPGPSGASVLQGFSVSAMASTAHSADRVINSGIYLFRPDAILEELRLYTPALLEQVLDAVTDRRMELGFDCPAPEVLLGCPAVSIEQAVFEHTLRGAVIPSDIRIGTGTNWSSVWRGSPQDASGNVTVGDVILQNSENCLIHSDGVLAAAVGLKDVSLVVTQDAVLAMHRDHVNDLDGVLKALQISGRQEAVSHKRCLRPWGFYESLILADRFQVKRLVVNPGSKLSLQKHFHRDEHWVVVHGSALVTRDDEQLLISENESIYLPLGCIHRLENPGRIPLTVIEVQVGRYLGEDDIVRIEDDYARS